MTSRRMVLRTLASVPFVAGSFQRAVASFLQPASVLQGSMWIYLWDLVDEGYDTVFTRLRDLGLTAVSCATAYHAGKFLAPHNPKRKVLFLEDGTVYFQPTERLYGRITPVVNSLVADGNDLAKVRRHAERFGLQTRSWVVCCHNTRLGRRYPDITGRTAFGDILYHNLCPSHPDVRAYLRALVRDIAGQGIPVIELEALQFQGYQHGEHHEREGVVLDTVPRFLLSLCFCDACHERARQHRLDLAGIQAAVRKLLEEFFADPDLLIDRFPTLESLPPDLFGPMMQWRTDVVTSLVQELSEAAGGAALRPMVSLDPIARQFVGVRPESIALLTGGVLTLGYVTDGRALRRGLASLQALLGTQDITVGFQIGMPGSGGRMEFLDRLATAREMGITSFNFYNYGFVPLKNLEWIREGLGEH